MPILITAVQASAAGFTRYFTGEPCSRGHVDERSVKSRTCLACQREKTKSWQTANPGYWKRKPSPYPNGVPEHRKAQKRLWKQANRHRAVFYQNKRRALKLSAGGRHTVEDVVDLVRLQRGKCAYCQISFSKTKRHVDHIRPLSRGGSDDRTNLQILCQPCNTTKGAKDPLDFARTIGRLC